MMRWIVLLGGILILLFAQAYARDMKPLEGGDLIVVEREMDAPSRQEGMDIAARDAVQSCVGRVYYSEQIVIARPLLEKYIDSYYKKYIFTVVVDSQKQIGDRIHLTMKVFVNYTRLLKDLEEKRFFFRPNVRPLFIVFLKETLDNESATYKDGWETVRSSWRDLTGQRLPETEITAPMFNVNVVETPALLAEAIRSAQKNGAEIIITGESSTVREKREEIYYDTYAFYRTNVTLKIIRADTGSILDESTATSLAGSTMQSQAINLSIVNAVRKAVFQLAEYYQNNWDKIVRNKGDYLLMFTGVSDEKLELIKKRLSSLDESAAVYVKSFYADTAVVNLVYKGNRQLLKDAIEGSSYPRMHIIKEEGSNFEVQIKN